jgi:hypothetical protein
MSVMAALSSVNAVQTTSIQIVHVGSAVAGSQGPISVAASVYYNGTMPGYQLRIAILDAETVPQSLVPGVVISSTDTCLIQDNAVALCAITTHAASGVEQINFQIGGIFGGKRAPGTWKLNMTAALFDNSSNLVPNSASSSPFEVTLTPVMLQVVVPSVVPVTVNGVEEPAGPALVGVPLGTNNVSAPALVQVNSTTRLRFDHWADGSGQANRTVTVTGNATIEADYVTQYLLTITGTEQNVTGPGWFDSGTNASFSIYPYQTASGLLGALGAKQTFQGFYENGQLITDQASGTIIMNTPHTLDAVWVTDYSTPAMILIGILVVVILGFLVARRRTKSPRRSTRSKSRRSRRRTPR